MRTWTSLFLLLLAVRIEAAPQFTDTDFVSADWEIVVFSFKYSGGAFPGGAVTASQETGGYPGTMRRVQDAVIAAPSANDYSTTWGVHLRSAPSGIRRPRGRGRSERSTTMRMRSSSRRQATDS